MYTMKAKMTARIMAIVLVISALMMAGAFDAADSYAASKFKVPSKVGSTKITYKGGKINAIKTDGSTMVLKYKGGKLNQIVQKGDTTLVYDVKLKKDGRVAQVRVDGGNAFLTDNYTYAGYAKCKKEVLKMGGGGTTSTLYIGKYKYDKKGSIRAATIITPGNEVSPKRTIKVTNSYKGKRLISRYMKANDGAIAMQKVKYKTIKTSKKEYKKINSYLNILVYTSVPINE